MILEFGILKFILLCLLLWAGLRAVHRLLQWMVSGKTQYAWLEQGFPVMAAIFWGILLIWSSHAIFDLPRLYSEILLGVLLFLAIGSGWPIIRDLGMGLFIRMEGSFKVQEHITAGRYQGLIRKLGYTALWLETDTGTLVKIPYGTLSRQWLQKSPPLQSGTLRFSLEIAKRGSLEQLIGEIRQYILNVPWTMINKAPQIQTVRESENSYGIEILCYLLDPRYAPVLENELHQKWGIH
ncbi:MAG: mechanosensitive ion channel family protein [SAR324 cluster bacterium]|nr:mechanosensitive ion channel family protein [SAR324 cluster bacterium]